MELIPEGQETLPLLRNPTNQGGRGDKVVTVVVEEVRLEEIIQVAVIQTTTTTRTRTKKRSQGEKRRNRGAVEEMTENLKTITRMMTPTPKMPV